MEEITQKALRKALTFNYWTVEKWLCYLINVGPTSTDKYYFQNGLAESDIRVGDLDNYALHTDKHNEEMQLKTALRYAELKAHWCDTDHVVQPRNKVSDPSDNNAEFPIRYFVAWAIKRNIDIYWLDWAIEQQLLPDPRKSASAGKLPFSVDWVMWGKIKKIELGDACGLLAGIDLPAFRYTQNKDHEWYQSVSEDDCGFQKHLAEASRRDMDAARDRIINKANIDVVVQNHILSGSFIDMEAVEVSLEQVIDSTLHGTLPEGAKSACNYYVDLQEFGSWAKSNGYDLPPEFPVRVKNDGAQEISPRKKVKALEMIESLKSLNDEYSKIDESNIPSELQRLILQYYGVKPTQAELKRDLSLNGLTISRPTFTDLYKRAFLTM